MWCIWNNFVNYEVLLNIMHHCIIKCAFPAAHQQRMKTVYKLIQVMLTNWSEASYYPKLTYSKRKSYLEVTTDANQCSVHPAFSSIYDSDNFNSLIGLSNVVSKSYLNGKMFTFPLWKCLESLLMWQNHDCLEFFRKQFHYPKLLR